MSSTNEACDADQLDWLGNTLDAWPSFVLVSVVESATGGPDRCTVYPHGADEALATEWITAEEDSFVSVADVR